MKREFLEGLGLEKEVIDKIMTENGTDIEKHKQEAEKAKSDLKEVQEQLTTTTATIDELKKSVGDNEVLKGKIQEYETQINDLKTNSENTKKEFSLREKLKDAGIKDVDYLIFKHGGLEKFAFDKDGNPIGIEETINPYKESIPYLFETGKTKSHYEPNGGGEYKGVNPFAAETFNATEAGKLFRENPAQAKALAEAVGYKI